MTARVEKPVDKARELETWALQPSGFVCRGDVVAIEEPLEVRIGGRTLTITMRTPGEDEELAAGFLLGEGVVRRREDLGAVALAGTNVVEVTLSAGVAAPWARLERHVYTTSSCGVCGKTSLDALRPLATPPAVEGKLVVDREVIARMGPALRAAQPAFDATGGLHASALFDESGELLALREDVGRHNALDKLLGAELLAGRIPLGRRLLMVSGRASFELVQKAVMAGLPMLVAVGAPSSLAVELAREQGMTLLGFVRESRFNVYSAPERIRGAST